MTQQISQEEKVDYIYETLKKQEKRRIWWIISKWGFRIFIVGYLYYFITFILPAMIDKIIPDMPNFSGATEKIELWKDQIKEIMNSYLSK